jgi:hypothetical protein
MSDWPGRLLAPPHSRSTNTHLSTNDLLDVIANRRIDAGIDSARLNLQNSERVRRVFRSHPAGDIALQPPQP